MHFHVRITDSGKIASSGGGEGNAILLNPFSNSLVNLRDSNRDFRIAKLALLIASAPIDAILGRITRKGQRANEIRNEIISKEDFARPWEMQFQREGDD